MTSMHPPPDVPVIRRPCYGLPPGAPCPSPDDCECFREGSMSMRDRAEQFLAYAFILVAISIVITGVWLLMEKAFGADNLPACLTKEQARAKFKTSHLYWHTERHCWDNQSGRHPRPKIRPSIEPNGNAAPPKKPIQVAQVIGPTVAYPTLISGGGTVNAMLQPDAMTRWPLVADFDADPPQFTPWQQRINLPARGGAPD